MIDPQMVHPGVHGNSNFDECCVFELLVSFLIKMPDVECYVREENWEYRSCTLQNSIKVFSCTVCGTRKQRVSVQGNSQGQDVEGMSTPICGKRKRNNTRGKKQKKKTQVQEKVKI